jgi:Domain of unknown function (DUF4314)
MKRGDRVRLVYCQDPYTKLKAGDIGTFQRYWTDDTHITRASIKWDSGSNLSMIEGLDVFVSMPDDDRQFDEIEKVRRET